MARPVKPEAVAKKRQKILDAAQRLMFTKGYEQMSIQDVLDEVQMSSGAFHHYFDSRRAMLEALVEQIRHETEKPLLPIIHDPQLSAIEKLQGFFDTLDRLRNARRADLVRLGQVWYADDNALVRQKVDEAIFQQRAPLLAEIVRQGVQEGIFTTAYPDQAGGIIMSLLQGMGDTHARLLFSLEQERDEEHRIEEIVTTHAASMDAIERVLGAPPYSFYRTNAQVVKVWVVALRENDQA
jgi:AcrR family transcriptional regulator